ATSTSVARRQPFGCRTERHFVPQGTDLTCRRATCLPGGPTMTLVYRNLVAWQRADDLFIDVHRLTYQQLPGSERYELGSQLRRAAYSVPANIVEGMTRDHPREAIQFFHIARASLNELAYGLHAAGRLGYLTTEQQRDLERQ